MALAKIQYTAVDAKGNVIPGATIDVRSEENGLRPILYTDRAGLLGVANPTTADGNGQINLFVEPGIYRIQSSSAGFASDYRYVEIGALELIRRETLLPRLYSTEAVSITGPDGVTLPANSLGYYSSTNKPRFIISPDGRFGFNTAANSLDTAYKFGPTDIVEDTRLTLYCVTNGTRADVTLSSASYHATFAHGTPSTAIIGENWGIAWGQNPAGSNGGYAIAGDHNNYIGINIGVNGGGAIVPPFPLPLVVGYNNGMSVFSPTAQAGFFENGAAYIITHNQTSAIECVFGDNGAAGVIGTVSGHSLSLKISGVDYTGIDVNGHWNFGLNGTNKNLSGIAALTCASLRINTAATTAAIAQAHWAAININGTSYKLLLGT